MTDRRVLTSPTTTSDIVLSGFIDLDRMEFEASGGTVYPPFVADASETLFAIDDISIREAGY